MTKENKNYQLILKKSDIHIQQAKTRTEEGIVSNLLFKKWQQ